MSHSAHRFYPAWTASTYTIYFKWRANEGVGSWASFTGSPLSIPTLVFSFSSPDNGVPVALIYESVVNHLRNCGIGTWWTPEEGDIDSCIRAAVESMVLPHGQSTGQMLLLFDGQFGSVYAA